MISAKIIADSIANGIRLVTMELCYPRFIHSEAKTHRILSLDDEEYELVLKQDVDLMDDPMLSRNASSSRAIPVQKMIKQVEENPATPIHWGKNQPGMKADIEYTGCEIPPLESLWRRASEDARYWASELEGMCIHKQIVNRLLEPFQWIKVIVTATEWDNFFKLRLHPDAQPEIQELARCMWGEISNSVPAALDPGEWHMPYLTSEEWYGFNIGSLTQEDLIKCSVARCARVSYNNHDNSSPNIEKDIALADRLLEAGHMSPFEHQATPMEEPSALEEDYTISPYIQWEDGITHMDRGGTYWSGNFRGFLQYRQMI